MTTHTEFNSYNENLITEFLQLRHFFSTSLLLLLNQSSTEHNTCDIRGTPSIAEEQNRKFTSEFQQNATRNIRRMPVIADEQKQGPASFTQGTFKRKHKRRTPLDRKLLTGRTEKRMSPVYFFFPSSLAPLLS
jgi:hypothetical protein